MTASPGECLTFAELADYWTSDEDVDLQAIEEHVFACSSCARLLAEAEDLRTAIRMATRSGHVQAFITDGVLNRLSREGVRVRTFALEPGEAVQCAAWADDEIIVARLRGDFASVDSADADLRLETGEPWGHGVDIPVRPGATELLLALPAAAVRHAPSVPMRLTLTAASGSSRGVIGEYIFEHEGQFQREEGESGKSR
jgi:hypothetical protein